jgi:hypothetical protein
MDLLRDNAIPFPDELEESRRFGPFATTFRYEDLLFEAELPFDRSRVLECIRMARGWAESVIQAEKN